MREQKTISARAWGELFLLAAIWGGIFLANRIALDTIGVFTLVAHRTLWAAFVLWLMVAIKGQSVPRSLKIWCAFLVMGILNNVVPFSLLNWAQLHIESGLTSIFNATTAIFTVLIAGLVFADEQLTTRKVLGLGLGFLGVCTAIGLNNLLSFDPRSIAQMAAVAATLSYALAAVWARKTMSGLVPHVAAAGMLTGASIIVVPLAWALDGPMTFDLPLSALVAIFYCAIIATAGAYLLYYRVLAMAGSGNLLLVTLLIPPFAIVLGAVVLGETLTPQAFAGFGLLALGLLVIDGRVMRRLTRKPAI